MGQRNKSKPPAVDMSGASVGEVAAQREQMAAERAKLKAEEVAAMADAEVRLKELKRLQDELETRGAVVERFRRDDGPELLELRFRSTVSIPGTGVRDKKRIVFRDIPELKRPKVVDLADQRKIVIVVHGENCHAFPYEGIESMVYAAMGSEG